jgi:sugar O-acyltransferase (sialic acid O-acetyltransferase NeuD family)
MSGDRGTAHILGAGGHAKVVIRTLQEAGVSVKAVFDDDPGKWGSRVIDIAVAGPIAEAVRAGIPAVVAVGDNAARRRIVESFDCEWLTAVHPRAIVDATVRLGRGTVVFAGAVIQPDTVIGDHVIVNTSVVIDHDCVVERYAHVGPTACLTGGVRVGEGALVGAGSVTIPGVNVGAWAVIGAGAAVTADVAPLSLALGVPARVRRGLTA